MTRKDFILIADAIRESGADDVSAYTIARSIGFALRRSNPRFELARFMSACGQDHHL